MLNTVIELLKSSGATAWEVTDTKRRGWEFYYIRHRLDQNRATQVESISVKVYMAFGDGKFLGSASAEIPPTATRAEAERTIAELCARAVYVQNPAYALRRPDGKAPDALSEVDVAANARAYLETMSRLPETATEDINSYEMFTGCVERRFVSSEGVDVTTRFPDSKLEVVVNAREGEREIELYRMYEGGSCDEGAIHADLAETFRFGRDKLIAGKTPNLGTCAVVFSTRAAQRLYQLLASRVSAQMRYQRVSDWAEGKEIAQGSGDRVTLRAAQCLPNSSRNSLYDAEGARVRDLTLIDRGVVKANWGNAQFSAYLGLEGTFMPGNWVAEGGTHTEEELRQGDFLEPVEFSDFQVNSITGDMAGEIRLGYWHHGGEVTVVSGGSVSGCLPQLLGEMRFSAAQKQYNNWLIPSVTRIEGASVTGAQ